MPFHPQGAGNAAAAPGGGGGQTAAQVNAAIDARRLTSALFLENAGGNSFTLRYQLGPAGAFGTLNVNVPKATIAALNTAAIESVRTEARAVNFAAKADSPGVYSFTDAQGNATDFTLEAVGADGEPVDVHVTSAALVLDNNGLLTATYQRSGGADLTSTLNIADYVQTTADTLDRDLLSNSTVAVANTPVVNLAATKAADASTIFAVAAPPNEAGTRFNCRIHLNIGDYTGAYPRAELKVVEVAADNTRSTIFDQRGIFIAEQNFTPIDIQPEVSTSTLEFIVKLSTISAYGNATAQLVDQAWIEVGHLERRAREIAEQEAKKAVGPILNITQANTEDIKAKADATLNNVPADLTAEQQDAFKQKLGVTGGVDYTVADADPQAELFVGVQQTTHTAAVLLMTYATIGSGAGTRYGFDRVAGGGALGGGFGADAAALAAAASVQQVVWYPATANALLRNRYRVAINSTAVRGRSFSLAVTTAVDAAIAVNALLSYSHTLAGVDYYESTDTFADQRIAGQVAFRFTYADGTHLVSDESVSVIRKIGQRIARLWLGIKDIAATSPVSDGASAALRWDDLDISALANENANTDNPPSTPRFFSGATITETDPTVLNAEVGTVEVGPLAAPAAASKIMLIDINRTYFGRLKIGPASAEALAATAGNLNFTARVTHHAADGTIKDEFDSDGRWLNLTLPKDIGFTIHSSTIAIGDYVTFEVVQRLTVTTLEYVILSLSALEVKTTTAIISGGAATSELTSPGGVFISGSASNLRGFISKLRANPAVANAAPAALAFDGSQYTGLEGWAEGKLALAVGQVADEIEFGLQGTYNDDSGNLTWVVTLGPVIGTDSPFQFEYSADLLTWTAAQSAASLYGRRFNVVTGQHGIPFVLAAAFANRGIGSTPLASGSPPVLSSQGGIHLACAFNLSDYPYYQFALSRVLNSNYDDKRRTLFSPLLPGSELGALPYANRNNHAIDVTMSLTWSDKYGLDVAIQHVTEDGIVYDAQNPRWDMNFIGDAGTGQVSILNIFYPRVSYAAMRLSLFGVRTKN